MRILIYCPQVAKYGGIEQHLCLLASEMGRVGHAVFFVTTSNSLGEPMREILNKGGVAFLELPIAVGFAGRLQKISWLLKTIVALSFFKWDVIYQWSKWDVFSLLVVGGEHYNSSSSPPYIRGFT